MDWALATRFQADKDLEVETGFRALPLDPSLGGASTWAKAGFDLTLPFGQSRGIEFQLSEAPVFGAKRGETVEDALAEGPIHFGAIMGAVGCRDGREVVLALDALRQAERLSRIEDGRYALLGGNPG